MIPFNRPAEIGKEREYISKVIENGKLCGDGFYSKRCQQLLEKMTGAKKVLLTSSGTDALEMAALLADIKAGDEVIMPSYTFVSTANAFVLRGAKTVFVDIRPDTMNIDEKLIEAAVTDKTRAVVPVHYAGVGCEMDAIETIAKKYGLCVIEDAAQGVNAFYKGRALGSIGDYGCFSFHETKNYVMGEGGAVLVNDENSLSRAEIVREKGTNRSQFLLGQVDKYSWVDVGSSFLPGELNAAYLCAQLEDPEIINADRLASWRLYDEGLRGLAERGLIETPFIPEHCRHNAHMYYIKVKDIEQRTRCISFLKEHGVNAVFHYVPLHSSPAGKNFGRFVGEDRYTTVESGRLLRLPMYYGLTEVEIQQVVTLLYEFFRIGGMKQ